MVKLVVEFAQVCFHLAVCVVESSIKWICPWMRQRKNLNKELVLITGAASGIGRLIALRLAKKGELIIEFYFGNVGFKMEFIGLCATRLCPALAKIFNSLFISKNCK